ncbi:hypothetical protein M378DRAFT_42800, partial [Amanita muscaria Koide BX008]
KPKPKSNTSDKENEGDRCSWTLDDDKILLDVLREQKVAGNQSESGWKPQVWTAVAQALKDRGKEKVDKLQHLSGFGWDNEKKLVTATEAVWEAYLAAHPKAARWRKTSFPLYDKMYFLVDGIIATGAGAFH